MTPAQTAATSPHVFPLPASQSESSPLRAFTSALARGDDRAWSDFHRDHGPRLFRQLLAATRGDHDLASEALQQTYLRVARHIRPCDSETQFASWLRTVARSVLHDCWRKNRRFRDLLQRRHTDPSDKDDSASESQLLATLDLALASLSPDDRDLLEAKYLRGSDVRSLAEQLGVTPKAVESRLTRARSALRLQIENALRHVQPHA